MWIPLNFPFLPTTWNTPETHGTQESKRPVTHRACLCLLQRLEGWLRGWCLVWVWIWRSYCINKKATYVYIYIYSIRTVHIYVCKYLVKASDQWRSDDFPHVVCFGTLGTVQSLAAVDSRNIPATTKKHPCGRSKLTLDILWNFSYRTATFIRSLSSQWHVIIVIDQERNTIFQSFIFGFICSFSAEYVLTTHKHMFVMVKLSDFRQWLKHTLPETNIAHENPHLSW